MRTLATLLFASVLSLSAAAQSSTPPCEGQFAQVRVSEITSTGSMDKFMAAVAAQKAWYSSHGFADHIFASSVVTRDSGAGTFSASPTQAITYHIYSTNMREPKHDDGWNAFVKMFQETSTIKQSYYTCLPKEMVPGTK